ncbi:MAG: gliding motility-associated C-terminal domain-containing protein [Bacteroidia bacterium]|nr:gliding motility-associated C-terminal domain-containing protein [Bacteroidia bacterium]
MKNKITKFFFSAIALVFLSNLAMAQAPFKYLTYVFPADSLKGFDEEVAKQEALSRGMVGSEYYVIMYSMKRDYINKKYGYYTAGPNSNAKGSNPVINAAPCVNEDFESSPSTTSTNTVGTIGTSLLGWQASWGQNSGINGSCTQNGCCPNANVTDAWIRTTPWTAPAPLGVIPASPFGGTKVIQMNDNITAKGEVVRIQQTFPVTPTNALFQFAYKACLNGSGHACCDQPYIRVELLDCMNNILACPQVSITAPGPSCATVSATGWSTNTSNISWTPNWIIKAIDLSPYLGSCVTIKVTVGDCDGWAHYGYAFFDFQCLPMTVTVNNIQFPAGSAAVSVAACGVSTATMVAPPGLAPYTWNGPPGSGITNNPNQTVTTTMAGNYTLTMNPPGICTPITKTVNLQFGTFPTAGFTVNNSCTTYTITNTGTAAPSIQTYTFVGPGAPSSFTTTSPTSVVNFPPSTTFTIHQTVTNPQNCPSTFTMVITTPPGPSPAFTAAPSFTQCLQGNSFTFNPVVTAGTHTWSFSPAAGAPAPGTGSPYGPVNFTSAGTYTVVHTINNAGCVSSTQSLVLVNAAPTASILTATAPPCAGATGSLTGAGGPGTLSWAGPNGWTGVGLNASVTNWQTVNNGVYTLTVNNFGCITTKTVNLSMGVVPTPTISNSGPVCLGQTLTLTATPPAGATFFYWYRPTPYYYGGYNIASPTIAITSTTQAGNYIFWYGFSGCPSQSVSTNVQIISPTSPTVSNTGPYCAGQTIQLNAVGSGTVVPTFTWTGPATFTGNISNPTRPNATTPMSGIYTVTMSIGSCKSTGTTNVVVNPIPNPIAGSNSPVCAGNTLSLTSSGGTTYTWSGPGAYTSTTQNPSITNVSSTNAGVYTVTVSNAQGCKNTATVNVTVTTPTTTAANTGPYCAGATIQLSTPAATTYTWTGPGGFTSALQNPSIANSTAAMSGVYTVSATTSGCKSTATTNVIVNPLPAPAAANTGPYCPGNTIQLNVGAFTTYTWSGPSAFSSNAQNPTIASAAVTNSGTYSISVADANGCVNTTTTNVVVNPTPNPIVGSNSPVCLSTAINLTATGGTGYSWSGPNGFTSALQNPTIASAAALNAGVYTVTVTSLGCTNTGTVNVTVLSPTTSATNTGPYCAGTTIQLNTPAGASYNWTGPGGFTSTLQNPTIPVSTTAMAGAYNVTVTVGTCTASATTNVVVNSLPVPAPTNTGAYCVGGSIQLNVGAFTTYTWSGPGGFTSNSQNPTITNILVTNAGSYSVAVTDANGCSNIAATNVVVNPLPTPVVNNPTTCENTVIGLTATGGTAYAWSGPGGFTSTTQNPNIPSALTSMNGNYTVTVTDANGCVNTAVATVSVIALPIPNAVTGGAVCVGATLNLNASGGTSYSWTGPNGFTSTSQNPNIPSATLNAGGTYTVVVTANTCTAATTVVGVINPLPTPNIVTNSPICTGQALNLTGSGGVSYSWSGPGGFTSMNQNPSIPSTNVGNSGNYVLTVTDANGCVNSTNSNVVINPTPNASAAGGTACENQNVSLSANGGATYAWSGPNGFTSNLQNPTIVSAPFAASGQYTVVVTSAAGCVSTAFTSIVVNPAPVPNIVINTPICVNNILNLSATGGVSYSWTGPNGFISTTSNPTVMANSTAYSGNYIVTVTDANGCSATANANAIINPLPNANITAINNTGCSPVCATFNITSSTPITTANWTLGDGSVGTGNTVNSCYVTTGIYTVNAVVTDANGCTNTAQNIAEVYPKPVADFNHAPLKPILNIDPEVTFTDASHSANIVSWQWYFMNTAQYTSTQQNPTFMYTEPGTYAVALVVKSDKGCIDTIVRPLVVGEDFGIYVPNAFTPNADGLNDVFQPKGFGIVEYQLQIFDRWGERVFSTKKFEEAWDGKYQGRGGDIIEQGTYTWLINVTSVFGKAHELKGHVTLIK